jgi:hypothetical protein
MRKVVWTLNVNDYAPEITAITYPLLRGYAAKIGAEFRIISERRWPDRAPVYEKLQIHELGRDNDWNIYIDSDTLVHPDFFDVTEHLTMDTVAHNGTDMAGNRWQYDDYFRRDGRHIGSCNWFTVGSRWCLDLWHPLEDLTYEEAIRRIWPINSEKIAQIDADHLIDDYTLSRNIARYGLKVTTVTEIMRKLNDGGNYLWHQYTIPTSEKPAEMRDVLRTWKLI